MVCIGEFGGDILQSGLVDEALAMAPLSTRRRYNASFRQYQPLPS